MDDMYQTDNTTILHDIPNAGDGGPVAYDMFEHVDPYRMDPSLIQPRSNGEHGIDANRGIPIDHGPPSTGSSPSVLVSVLVPVLSVFILVMLTVTACRTWKYYHKPSKKRQENTSNFDPERQYEEQEPLRQEIIENRSADMQIVQESDFKSVATTHREDEQRSMRCNPPSGKSLTVKFAGVETKLDDNNMTNGVTIEEICERPKTLKFLAASVAFQASTVPALKRLPYTPDPDYALCDVHESIVTSEIANSESQDKVTPLVLPKRARMKPRGLLERRGSNVALTISLRCGEKNNAVTTITSTKSPKPLAYLQKASAPLSPSELQSKSCDTLRLQQEFWEIPMNHPSEKHFNVAGHGTKNRYRSILPNEHSRVKLPLTPGEDPLSTYINANYIRDCTDMKDLCPAADTDDDDGMTTPVTKDDAAFIATQGPMANTVVDFWRMIWQEDVATIIMITKLKERKEKCTKYLPFEVDESCTFDDITIKVANVKKYEHFTVRSMEINHNGQMRSLNHYWYTTWMDHETPEKTRGLLELVQEVSLWNKHTHGPMVVHCSAGIGRTGCYIAVTVGCQQLTKTGKADILRTVSQMRLDRGGMIQTWEQYQFVHQALNRYGRILAGENVTTPSTTGSIRSPPESNPRSSAPKDPVPVEPARPQTPKHRRSMSETNLPSPKEMRLISNTVNMCNNNTLPISADRNRQSRRKNKLRIAKPDNPSTPPSTPLPTDGLTSPQLGVVKSVSSPTIRSPFARLCLQAKDLNASSSPLASSKFEWPENNTAQVESTKDKEPLKLNLKPEIMDNQRKGFTFNFAAISNPPESPHSPCGDSKTLHKPPPKKGQFSFDLPMFKPGQFTNGESHKDFTLEPTTPGCASDKTTPGTVANLSHFVFPVSDKR